MLAETIPMHGRMIHGKKAGELYEASQAYDAFGRVSVMTKSLALTDQVSPYER